VRFVVAKHLSPHVLLITLDDRAEQCDPGGERGPLEVEPPPLVEQLLDVDVAETVLRRNHVGHLVEVRRHGSDKAGGPAGLHPRCMFRPPKTIEIERLHSLEQVGLLEGVSDRLVAEATADEVVAVGDPGVDGRKHVGVPLADQHADLGRGSDRLPADELLVGCAEFIRESRDPLERRLGFEACAHVDGYLEVLETPSR
jgi:hypothetical protein